MNAVNVSTTGCRKNRQDVVRHAITIPGSTSKAAALRRSAFSSSKIRSDARLKKAGSPARSVRVMASGSAASAAPVLIGFGLGKGAECIEPALQARLGGAVAQTIRERRCGGDWESSRLRQHTSVQTMQA